MSLFNSILNTIGISKSQSPKAEEKKENFPETEITENSTLISEFFEKEALLLNNSSISADLIKSPIKDDFLNETSTTLTKQIKNEMSLLEFPDVF